VNAILHLPQRLLYPPVLSMLSRVYHRCRVRRFWGLSLPTLPSQSVHFYFSMAQRAQARIWTPFSTGNANPTFTPERGLYGAMALGMSGLLVFWRRKRGA